MSSRKVFTAFSVTSAVVLESPRVVSFDISVILYPFRLKEPLTCKLPVKLWVSSIVSPNLVEPLSNIIDAETNSVLNSCAVIVPPTVALPWTVMFPVVVVEPVITKLPLIELESKVTPFVIKELADTWLKITLLVVDTSCPIQRGFIRLD